MKRANISICGLYNGALTLSLEGTGTTDEGMYTADLKVTKGNNTKRVYMVKWAGEAQPGDIDDFVKTLSFFETFDPEVTGKQVKNPGNFLVRMGTPFSQCLM